MERIYVKGGVPLYGTVAVGGSKNAALPLLFAGILTGESCVFHRLPRVSDILKTLEILKFTGAKICFYPTGEITVDYRQVRPVLPPACYTGAIRGSTYLLGSMLGRFGEARFAGAGGCDFGTRPIDQHLAGFSALGATISEEGAELHLHAPKGLSGADFRLAMPSVGATANLMMAAVGADGESCLRNTAEEPHVRALADFLRKAGAEIVSEEGGVLRVSGGRPLHGCEFTVIPDMIEAGTYLAMGLACGGRVTVTQTAAQDLEAVILTLHQMGGEVEIGEDSITVSSTGGYRCVDLETGPYPAFPTDLHPQFAALFAIGGRASGSGTVTERVFPTRFRYTEELCRMGADIRVAGSTARITPAPLQAREVFMTDLRGGAALLLAALATEGESVLHRAELLGRGYEHPIEKLSALGAVVRAE